MDPVSEIIDLDDEESQHTEDDQEEETSFEEEEPVPVSGTSASAMQDVSGPRTKKPKMDKQLPFKDRMYTILRKISDFAPGGFVASGKLQNVPLMAISIANMDNGRLTFPLCADSADKIIKSCDQSPYGRGSETVVDTSVRNSWQLEPEGFQILNPEWNIYVNEVLVPLIKKEMVIESPFKASLYKLLLYKTGSFFKPHRDSEKEDGMFATLVVQLPSKYQGGQLVVSHDGKTQTIDFSSCGPTSTNEFSTFFSVFYCDCQHEILPVTEGVRLCLIYNLISQKSDNIPAAPRVQKFENDLITLCKSWNTPTKIIYALKHKYSERNLSFTNLKTTDRAVVNVLKQAAKESGVSIYLGIFKKQCSGQADESPPYSHYGHGGINYNDYDVNSDGDLETSYELTNLVSVSGVNIFGTSNLNVDFEEEVIPENCFENIEPYDKQVEDNTGNAGIEVSKFYRSSAVVLWPKQFILQILKSGGVGVDVIHALFLKKVEKYQGKEKDEKTKRKLLHLANVVVSSRCTRADNSVRLIQAIVGMDNLKLIQDLFANCVNISEATLPLIINECEKYGWQNFSAQIISKFKCLSKENAIDFLNRLVGNSDLEESKKSISHSILQGILEMCKGATPGYSSWYVRPPTAEEKLKKQKDDQDLLYTLCRLAQKINFPMNEFVKTKPLVIAVPVLLRLVPANSSSSGQQNVLEEFWMDIAMHFLAEMEKQVQKPVVVTNWKRDVKTTCSCSDCSDLYSFLRSDRVSQGFKMGKQRRQHLHQRMNYMTDLAHETDRGGHIGVLVVTKTQKTGQEELQTRNVSDALLAKLREVVRRD